MQRIHRVIVSARGAMSAVVMNTQLTLCRAAIKDKPLKLPHSTFGAAL